MSRTLWHKIRPAFREAARHKARTGLVLFGVSVAVAAMTFIVSLSIISRELVEKEIMGTITVSSKTDLIPRDLIDGLASRFDWIEATMPIAFFPLPPTLLESRAPDGTKRSAHVGVVALDPRLPAYGYFRNRSGAALPDGTERAAILSPGAADRLFPDGIPEAAAVTFRLPGTTGDAAASRKLQSPAPQNLRWRVAGRMDSFLFDEMLDAHFSFQPDLVYVPVRAYWSAPGAKQGCNLLFLRLKNPKDARRGAGEIQRYFNAKIQPPVRVIQFAHVVEEAEQAAGRMMTVAVLYIALIFISTGATLMNVTFVSVAQRTREIGIRRATGARRSDVFLHFFAETALLGMTGSLIGLALGLLGARHVWFNVLDSPYLDLPMLRSAFFALLAGASCVAFGLSPSLRAASISPVRAIKADR